MEKYNGLNVPPTPINWEELQESLCSKTKGCELLKCRTCLFFETNLNEFKTWFKSNLKNEERENTQS